ncbi:MAG: hypothetical protein ACI4UE_00460 [Candidatus Scatovivens sp.]
MQKTTTVKATIGEFLFRLSISDENGKKAIMDTLEMLIDRYPEERNILMHLMEEAEKGKQKTSLKSGVLVPDFSKEGIHNTISDGCTTVSWNK